MLLTKDTKAAIVQENRKAIKKSKRIEPTTHKTAVFCDGCGSESFVFFTNYELWNGIFIKRWCRKCGKVTEWKKQESES